MRKQPLPKFFSDHGKKPVRILLTGGTAEKDISFSFTVLRTTMFATAHATTSAFLVAVVARAKTSTCAPLVTSATDTGTTVTALRSAQTPRTNLSPARFGH